MKTKKVDTIIKDQEGNIVFEKKDFEVPEEWSTRAGTIMASKYATDDENSAIAVIDRVVNQITQWGIEQGYFGDKIPKVKTPDNVLRNIDGTGVGFDESKIKEFKTALKDILVNQRALFNSPVMMNV